MQLDQFADAQWRTFMRAGLQQPEPRRGIRYLQCGFELYDLRVIAQLAIRVHARRAGLRIWVYDSRREVLIKSGTVANAGFGRLRLQELRRLINTQDPVVASLRWFRDFRSSVPRDLSGWSQVFQNLDVEPLSVIQPEPLSVKETAHA